MSFNRNITKTHPGPQTQIHRFNAVFSFLLLFTIIFFLLTIYAIFKQNFEYFSLPELENSIEILDTKTACSLFATFLGLLLVRNQFIVGSKPKIVYECVKTKSSSNPELENKGILWQVRMHNVGLGAAAFLSYKFRVGIDCINDGEYVDYATTIEELKKNGLLLEEDFYLLNITFGGAMSAKDQQIIFEILLSVGYKIKQIDARVIFEGYLGGRYQKDMYLIPRLGIPNKTSEKPSIEYVEYPVD